MREVEVLVVSEVVVDDEVVVVDVGEAVVVEVVADVVEEG